MEHGGGPAWALALETSGLGQAIRESVWVYPLANVGHVVAVAVLFGSILVFDLRVIGAAASPPAAALARLALPLARLGFLVAVPSGFIMFAAEATAYIANPVFLIKLGLILLALLNLAAFHAGAFRRVDSWPERAPATARLAAGLSLAAWAGTLICGRFAAYW